MIALAAELRRRGHIVSLCVPEKYRSKLMELEFRMVTCGVSFEDFLAGGRAGDGSDFLKELTAQVPTQFVAMRDALLEAEILVSGGFMTAAASLAEQLKLPFFNVIQTPAYLDAAQHPLACVPLRRGLFESMRRKQLRNEWQTLLGGALNRERQYSGLPPVADVHNHLFRSGHQLITVDASVAPVPAGVAGNVTGFWNFREENQQSADFLSSVSAPVYVDRLPLQSEVSPMFIRQLCDRLSKSGIRAIVSSQWPGIESNSLPQGCIVADAYPEDRFGAIVHAGTASMFSVAAHAGVPQIIVPQFLEHGYWGERVAELRVGPAPLMRPDADRVAQSVKDTLSGNEYRTRSAELARKLNEQNGPAVAADLIEKLSGKAEHGK